jgi:hypothetical protein
VGVWIAFVQSRIARVKLQHDLFDRRFAVYEATRTLLLIVMRKGTASMEDLSKFTMGAIDAVFLLDEPTSAYLQDIRQRTVKLQSRSASIDANVPVADDRAELVDKTHQEKNWLVDQLNIIPEKFMPFLKLT